MRQRTNWTEKELYYTIKGSADKKNPEVIKIAEILGKNPDGTFRHSPSSIVMKLGNYKACDPNRIGGLQNRSNDDIYYFDTYAQNIELLFERVKFHLSRNKRISSAEAYLDIPEFWSDVFLAGNEAVSDSDMLALKKVRTKQNVFRNELLNIYDHHCCLSRIGSNELLVASHIKPWAVDKEHRTDPRNGLLLKALLDRSFDQGLFTFDSNFTVRVSPNIKDK